MDALLRNGTARATPDFFLCSLYILFAASCSTTQSFRHNFYREAGVRVQLMVLLRPLHRYFCSRLHSWNLEILFLFPGLHQSLERTLSEPDIYGLTSTAAVVGHCSSWTHLEPFHG